MYLASLFAIGLFELARGECLGDLYLSFGLTAALGGKDAFFGIFDIEGVYYRIVSCYCFYCLGTFTVVVSAGFFGGEDTMNFLRLVLYCLLGFSNCLVLAGDIPLPTCSCCCCYYYSDGLIILTPGRISATLGTGGFFE